MCNHANSTTCSLWGNVYLLEEVSQLTDNAAVLGGWGVAPVAVRQEIVSQYRRVGQRLKYTVHETSVAEVVESTEALRARRGGGGGGEEEEEGEGEGEEGEGKGGGGRGERERGEREGEKEGEGGRERGRGRGGKGEGEEEGGWEQ